MKILYRSESNIRIAGVCGGLGEFFGIDPTIFRVIFIFLLLPGGLPGLLPYLLLWIFIPTESKARKTKLSEDAEYIPPNKKSK